MKSICGWLLNRKKIIFCCLSVSLMLMAVFFLNRYHEINLKIIPAQVVTGRGELSINGRKLKILEIKVVDVQDIIMAVNANGNEYMTDISADERKELKVLLMTISLEEKVNNDDTYISPIWTNGDSEPEVSRMIAVSGVWSKGVDVQLFPMLNQFNHPNDKTARVVTLPYLLKKEDFELGNWKKVDKRTFQLIYYDYPKTYQIYPDTKHVP